ncbi:MAG: transposase [Nitrospirota bacterium]
MRRKNIRLPGEAYRQPGRVFSITICTAQRRRLFLDATLAETAVRSLRSGPFGVGASLLVYCLMPDHLHLLIEIKNDDLVKLIGNWKRFTSNILRKQGINGQVWQRGFFDHALRKEEDLRIAAEYILMNPVRSGLVERSEDYPYAWHRWVG